MKLLSIKTIFILALLLLCSSDVFSSDGQECVILLHGMGRTKLSMKIIEDTLKENYIVFNESYSSTSKSIEDLAGFHIDRGAQFCSDRDSTAVHFVTHSLGGILVRHYLQDHSIKNLGNIVMLSPPNKGSEVADKLKDTYLYQLLTGPAGQQLGTESGSLPNKLNPVNAKIGIIAGNTSLDPWFSPLIPGEDDGKVSVESTKLNEMSDFIVVERGHTFIMRSSVVIKQIEYFLKNGKFEK